MVELNPNTKQFYNKLYNGDGANGTWEINDFSVPWNYEQKEDKLFYHNLLKLPVEAGLSKEVGVGWKRNE